MILPSCREVSRMLSSGELDDAPWWTRALSRAHLWHCGVCSRFARELRLVAAAFRRLAVPEPEAVSRLEAALRSRLAP